LQEPEVVVVLVEVGLPLEQVAWGAELTERLQDTPLQLLQILAVAAEEESLAAQAPLAQLLSAIPYPQSMKTLFTLLAGKHQRSLTVTQSMLFTNLNK
jgi:hypothetical protein